MAKGSDKLPHDDWSPLLRRVALDDTRRPSRDAVQSLTDRDVKILRKLADEKQPAHGIRQDKVLAVLSERAPDVDTAKVFERVIADLERPALLRTVAAIGLGRIPAAVSEEILFAHVADNNAAVAQRVIQSLGRISSSEGLKKLDAMEPPKPPCVLQQWRFSKRLIRHRLGLRGNEPPRIQGTAWATEGAGEPCRLPIANIALERLEATIADIRDEVFGIELAGDRGYSFESDRCLQYLLIAQPLTTRDGLKRLEEIPMVAAVIAMWEQRTSKPILDQIVLTEPLDDSVLVQGFRQDGTLLFEGQAAVRGAAANFTIINTDRAAQCRFRVTGELKPEGLVARVETMPRQKSRQTQPLLGTAK